MKLPRRFWLLISVLCFDVTTFATGAWSQDKVRLAHSALEGSNAVWYVAQARGFYKKNGLDAD